MILFPSVCLLYIFSLSWDVLVRRVSVWRRGTANWKNVSSFSLLELWIRLSYVSTGFDAAHSFRNKICIKVFKYHTLCLSSPPVCCTSFPAYPTWYKSSLNTFVGRKLESVLVFGYLSCAILNVSEGQNLFRGNWFGNSISRPACRH